MKYFIFLMLAVSAMNSPEWSKKQVSGFTLLYVPGSEGVVRIIEPLLEPEVERISRTLGTGPPEGVTIVAAPDPATFRRLQGGVPSWATGVAYPGRSLIYLRPFTGVEVRHSTQGSVLSHELAHIVLHKRLNGHSPPQWLDEGVAVFMAREPLFSRVEMLVPIAITGRSIPFRKLEHRFPRSPGPASTAYAQSGDFIRFLYNYQDQGSGRFYNFLDLLSSGVDPDDALKRAYGKTLFDLETEWLERVRRSYAFVPLFSGGAFLWFLLSLLAIIAFGRKWLQKRARRAKEYEEWDSGVSEPRPGLHDDEHSRDWDDPYVH